MAKVLIDGMTGDELYSFTGKQLEGQTVRSRRILQNAYATFPEGTLFNVERKYSGLELRSAPCSCCGLSLRISKVPAYAVRLVMTNERM